MTLARGDLVLCAGTVLGSPLVERIPAASAAGFRGMSIWPDDYRRARATGLSDGDMRAMLDDHGLAIAEVDAVSRWLPASDGALPPFGQGLDEVLAVADALGARSINVLELTGTPFQLEVAAEAFASLCQRAREHGLLAHLEFLPWSAIRDAAAAWRIVAMAGCDNGGLMLDAWHHIRSGEGHQALRDVPGDRIFALQLADAPAVADGHVFDETLRRRRLPGQGDGDVAGLMRLLDELGCAAPVGVEVFSEELAALSAADAAARAGDATRAVLASARGRSVA